MTWMATSTRVIWRGIRDAMPAGLRPSAVRALAPELPEKTIRGRLRLMHDAGYLRFEGPNQTGVWKVGSRVPAGEVATPGAPSMAHPPLRVVPPPKPRVNCVWQLGRLAQGQQS